MCADLLAEFEASIEAFVAGRLPAFVASTVPSEPKVIHDAVWGSHVYEPWETAIIDTMLMQRLREVRQTSFAYLTYPAANHSRFEHSLGTVVMADRMTNILMSRSVAGETKPSHSERLEVRLAALLHDCGHVFLSHIGEAQLKGDQQVHAFRAKDRGDPGLTKRLKGCKIHELLSFAIVKSAAFRTYFEKLREHYAERTPELTSVKLDEVAGYIVGYAHYEKQYLADVINGNFDADKLDYFTRDAYFTGLHIDLDIDRLLYATRVMPVDEKWFVALCESEGKDISLPRDSQLSVDVPNRLVVKACGVSTLEQILFAKMQLTSSVYHHHKIRCADAMLTSYMDYMAANMGKVPAADRLRSPVDFMSRSDRVWLHGNHADEYLTSIAENLRARTLPKRALVISMRTAKNRDGVTRLSSDHPEKAAVLRRLRRSILDLLNAHDDKHTLQEHDIILDFPDVPSLREASQSPILVAEGALDVMNNWVPTNSWLNTYFTHKWQARVFCPDTPDGVRLKVAKAAREVFSLATGIELELTDDAWRLAGLRPADVEAAY